MTLVTGGPGRVTDVELTEGTGEREAESVGVAEGEGRRWSEDSKALSETLEEPLSFLSIDVCNTFKSRSGDEGVWAGELEEGWCGSEEGESSIEEGDVLVLETTDFGDWTTGCVVAEDPLGVRPPPVVVRRLVECSVSDGTESVEKLLVIAVDDIVTEITDSAGLLLRDVITESGTLRLELLDVTEMAVGVVGTLDKSGWTPGATRTEEAADKSGFRGE